MAITSDVVYQQSTSTGTGSINLAAVNGRRTFAGAFGTGVTTNVFFYFISASNGSSFDEWEIGQGHMSNATTLVRDTVIASSNSNALVNFSGGILDITSDLPSANQVYTDGIAVTAGDVAIFADASGNKLKAAGGLGRNRCINPSLSIAQAGVGSTADAAYTGIDQWYGLVQTAAVMSSQLAAVASAVPSMGRITQSQASAQRFGIAQPFENAAVADLRGKTVTLSALARMSAATTLRYAILEWTGTADTITKDVVNSWTNTTFTAGQFFLGSNLTVSATGSTALSSNTLTAISLSASISTSMNNIIIFFWTDSAQAQTVTLDIGNVFFGQGSSAPPVFDLPDPALELAKCWKFFQNGVPALSGVVNGTAASAFRMNCPLNPKMRVTPTVTLTANLPVFDGAAQAAITAIAANNSSPVVLELDTTISAGLTAFRRVGTFQNGTGNINIDARL